MKSILLTCIISFSLTFLNCQGQDAEFSQFYANPVYLNPAFAGSAICPRVSINFRDQWPGIQEGFKTYSVSYDRYIKKLSGGVALQILKDGSASGVYNTIAVNGVYAYHKKISKDLVLDAGFKLGYLQRSLNLNELIYADQIDKSDGVVRATSDVIGMESNVGLDISTGAMIHSDRFFTGFVVHHLVNRGIDLTEEKLIPKRYALHAGVNIPIDDGESSEINLSPNILFTKQGPFNQLNIGFYATKGLITGGLWYRSNDAMILLLGIDATRYKLGYSYDITLSKLGNVSGGAHELSFVYRLPCREKRFKYTGEKCVKIVPEANRRNFSAIKCPSF